jgi:hypothetical protein
MPIKCCRYYETSHFARLFSGRVMGREKMFKTLKPKEY